MKCYCRRGAGWRGDLGVALLLSVHGGGVLHASQGTQAPSLVGTEVSEASGLFRVSA